LKDEVTPQRWFAGCDRKKGAIMAKETNMQQILFENDEDARLSLFAMLDVAAKCSDTPLEGLLSQLYANGEMERVLSDHFGMTADELKHEVERISGDMPSRGALMRGEGIAKLLQGFDDEMSTTAPEVRHGEFLLDVLAKLGREYDVSVEVSIADLVEMGRDEARRMLSEITNAKVVDDGEQFLFVATDKYSPKGITFVLDESNKLPYCSTGEFTEAVRHGSATLCDALSLLGFDINGDTSRATIAWGGAEEREDGWYFQPMSAEASDMLLLAVPWGGAHDKRHGLTEQEVNMLENVAVSYFEKAVSKGGGEGVDYYLIELIGEELQNAVAETETRLMMNDFMVAVEFGHKHRMINALDESSKELYTESMAITGALAKFALETHKKVKEVAPNALVTSCPLITGVVRPIQPGAYGYETSLCELRKAQVEVAQQKLDMRKAERRNLIRIRLYGEIAPKYAQLESLITESCHGLMEIRGDEVVIWLPNGEGSAPALVEHTFGYNEEQLSKCILTIRKSMQAQETSAEENATAIAELESTKPTITE